MSVCVYLATEKTVADDISDGLKQSADAIESLLNLLKIAEKELGELAKLKMRPTRTDPEYLVSYWRTAFHSLRGSVRHALTQIREARQE